MSRKTISQLEAELAKTQAEVEAWKEAHAALARAIQPSIVNVPYVPASYPPFYVPPYIGPALPWGITCDNTAPICNGHGGGGGGVMEISIGTFGLGGVQS